MTRYLLDSDAVINFLTGFESTVSLIRGLHDQGNTLCVCDVVIAEVFAGVHPRDRGKVRRLLVSCPYLATSREAAQQAGEWRHAFARQGIALSTTDVLVAATALAHQATLVTGNRSHYPMTELAAIALPRATS